MVKLLLFAPCEKLIVNKDENTSSLITILETINIPALPTEEGVPEDSAVPFRWYACALWHAETDEDYGPYEQRLKLITPDARELFEAVIPFVFGPPHRNHRITGFYPLFPIMPSGTAFVSLELRRVAENILDWQEIARFPIVIVRTEPPTTEQPKAS